MNKTAIATIVASVIAGTSCFGYFTNVTIDRNVDRIKQIDTHQQVKQPIANESNSFRNIKVTSQSVAFVIKGEASVFEGTFHYTVKQGEKVIVENFGTASIGGPEWGKVEQQINIPWNKMSGHSPLTIELYEIDQESGQKVRVMQIPLTIGSDSNSYKNESFRNITVAPVSFEYSIKGEARLHEGTFNYDVKQGVKKIASGFGTSSIGAPDWGQLEQKITIPLESFSGDQPITLELYSIDQESGKAVDTKVIMLK